MVPTVPRWSYMGQSQQGQGVTEHGYKGSLFRCFACDWASSILSLLFFIFISVDCWVDRCSYQQNIMNPKFVNGFNITSTPLPPWCIIPNTFKLDTSCSTKCFSSKSGSRKQHNLEDKYHNLFLFLRKQLFIVKSELRVQCACYPYLIFVNLGTTLHYLAL